MQKFKRPFPGTFLRSSSALLQVNIGYIQSIQAAAAHESDNFVNHRTAKISQWRQSAAHPKNTRFSGRKNSTRKRELSWEFFNPFIFNPLKISQLSFEKR